MVDPGSPFFLEIHGVLEAGEGLFVAALDVAEGEPLGGVLEQCGETGALRQGGEVEIEGDDDGAGGEVRQRGIGYGGDGQRGRVGRIADGDRGQVASRGEVSAAGVEFARRDHGRQAEQRDAGQDRVVDCDAVDQAQGSGCGFGGRESAGRKGFRWVEEQAWQRGEARRCGAVEDGDVGGMTGVLEASSIDGCGCR